MYSQVEDNHMKAMNIEMKNIREDFVEFTKEESIKSTDYDKIYEWVKSRENIELKLIRDNKIIYHSDDDEFLVYNTEKDNKESTNSFDEINSGPYKIEMDGEGAEIIFSSELIDGEIVGIIKEYKDYIWFDVLTALSVIFSIVLFIGIFLYLLREKIKYIKEIEESIKILESGNLNHQIPQIGNDELQNLASNINKMSEAMKERIEGEAKAQEASKNLITDISHDIRTPLTPIIGYLTILKENKNISEEEKDKYIDLVLSKANQLRERTNMLFDYALLYSNQKSLERITINAKDLLEQLIFEHSCILERNEFKVDYINNQNQNVQINVDVNEINRIFDNITSNIIKYADKSYPISIEVILENENIKIKIQNNINKTESKRESTKLGINICENIMKLHEGKFSVYINEDIYTVEIDIPIIN